MLEERIHMALRKEFERQTGEYAHPGEYWFKMNDVLIDITALTKAVIGAILEGNQSEVDISHHLRPSRIKRMV